jgi:capsular polysaccharide biosynthesis protein
LQEEAARRFARYTKAKRAAREISERLERVEPELAALERRRAELERIVAARDEAALASLVAAILSVAALPQPLPSYQATVQLGVSPTVFPSASYQQYGEYYLFLASEFLNDDVINVVEGSGFLDALKTRYAGRPGGPPNGSIKGKKAHRVITFTVSSDSGADAMTMAQGIQELLANPGPNDPKYLEIFSEQQPRVTVIDPPRLIVQPGVRRGALDVGVRTLLGLVVGLALAFLLHYLDDTVRGRDDLEGIGLPVLAEIPRPGRERLAVKP